MKNKRGMIFTIMVIALLSFFLISYSGYEIIKDRRPIEKRIGTLNNFVDSVERDLSRHLFISGYRTIFVLQQYTLDRHEYISDLNSSIEEVFFNGSLYGEQKSLMDDGKFSDILSSLNANGKKINAQVFMNNPQVEMYQDDPWNVKFNMTVNLNIKDASNLAEWNKTKTFSATIPITTFIDPVYHVGTSGMLTNEISESPFSNFVSGGDYSNLSNHAQSSFYISSNLAPSFLQRLEGELSSSEFGIESIVYPQDLVDVGISVKYKSLVDYIYFSNNNPQGYSIPAITNLILDNQSSRLSIYNVSDVAVSI